MPPQPNATTIYLPGETHRSLLAVKHDIENREGKTVSWHSVIDELTRLWNHSDSGSGTAGEGEG